MVVEGLEIRFLELEHLEPRAWSFICEGQGPGDFIAQS